MAKFQKVIKDDFRSVLNFCDEAVNSGSFTVSLEESSEYRVGDTQVAIRAYERYSYFGKNRVALNFTLVCVNNVCYLTATSTGGSQGTFFKINTFGEESFLDTLASQIEKRYK